MIKLDEKYFSPEELATLQTLLAPFDGRLPQLEDLWQLMDTVWDSLGCNQHDPQPKCLQKFYAHPVWVLNGLFVEQDATSMQHRTRLADWVAEKDFQAILDYGGGFGTLARAIASRCDAQVDIYEPYPSKLALAKSSDYPNIRFCDRLDRTYDCVIAMDVLEHVTDPLNTFSEMAACLQIGGSMVLANHFYPAIKCHLPSTFHFRYTFGFFAWILGFRPEGPQRRQYLQIWQKKKTVQPYWPAIRLLEKISRTSFPVMAYLHTKVRNQ